jgi:hypothetical protein
MNRSLPSSHLWRTREARNMPKRLRFAIGAGLIVAAIGYRSAGIL